MNHIQCFKHVLYVGIPYIEISSISFVIEDIIDVTGVFIAKQTYFDMSNHLLDVCAIIDISQDGGWFQMIKIK